MKNVPCNSQEMEIFKMNPYRGKTIGGLNGGVPNRRERRAKFKKPKSSKIPKGSPYRLTYIKNMNLKEAIENYAGSVIDSVRSPKLGHILNKIKVIRSIREIKQRIELKKDSNT